MLRKKFFCLSQIAIVSLEARESFIRWKKKNLYVACHRHRNGHRIRRDIHMHTYIHTYIHIHTHVCIRIYTYIDTCLYIYIRMHLCIYKFQSIILPASVLRYITYFIFFFCYIDNTPISIENQTQFKKNQTHVEEQFLGRRMLRQIYIFLTLREKIRRL